jgi:hypothetical protein
MTTAAQRANPNWRIFNLAQAIERLPLEAQRKYRSLRAGIEDAEVLMRSAFAREQAVEQKLRALEQSPVGPRDSEAAAERRAEIAALADELDALNGERGRRQSQLNNTTQVLSQLDGAIPPLIEQRLPLRAVTSAQPEPGTPLDAAILRVRGDIGRIKAELYRLAVATLPAAEVKKQIVEQINKLADEGCPRLDLRNGEVKISWPDFTPFSNPGAPLASPPLGASKLLAWLFHDELIAAVTDGIDDHIAGGIGIAERNARKAALQAQLLDLEFEEESLVEAALALGVEVHRRPGADPLALLGLEIATADDDEDAVEDEAVA